jgi:ketosteroid isomerase-like protein
MSAEDDVRDASGRFYAALNSIFKGDAGPMAGVWSQSAAVTAQHPLGGRQVGWKEVEGSFAQVASLASGGRVKPTEQRIQAAGDLGYEVAIEQGEVTLGGQHFPIEHRVTNIYRREPGGWKIVHHHTDVSPALADLAKRLQAKP